MREESKVKFPDVIRNPELEVESLLNNGIPHHNTIVYGDITDELKEFAKLMRIPIVICA